MTFLFHSWFDRWTDTTQRIKRLEAKGCYEAAWKIAARENLRRMQEDIRYMWTWEYGEDSLRLARLALNASGYEKSWYGAMHALALFDWKGLPIDDPMCKEAEAIVQTAEGEIHQLRLLDLENEMQVHLEIYDKEKRIDRKADFALQDGRMRKKDIQKMFNKAFGGLRGIDLHGRWP